ncbi:M20 family metallopeptidase [Senegalia sp. (in: firmicutes)]|uniref:M20 family metallopeptidase n=2 Tax=Senegalia sp. (in: firmicutes) TaxID=1924098 RepID=UPI003F94F390
MTDNYREYINEERTVELLSSLIEIESPYFREDKIMDYAYNLMKEKDIPVEMHEYEDQKITKYKGKNVIGTLKGKKDGPKILLNGHLDTVEICEGWTYDPLKARREGNRLYGLGALDMKSGVAAIILALEAFKNTIKEFDGQILYSLVSDEEGPFGLGTDALIEDDLTKDVDVAIVPEPSSGFSGCDFPCLCLGARGGYNYSVNFKGKSSHAAAPELGINAISDAAKVIVELEQMQGLKDDKLGQGSFALVEINGGGAACSVADKAQFTAFRHIVRGEDKEYIIDEVNRAVKKANIKSQVEVNFRKSPSKDSDGFLPYTVDEDNEYTSLIQESIKNVTGDEATTAYFSSIGDFNYIGTRVGVPTFVFGPHGENYHASDEYVLIDTVVKTAEVIYDFLKRTLNAR